jgi:glycerophosphoryl diester phosphodiesterase
MILAAILCHALAQAADGDGSSTFLQNGVTAHRGDSGHYPENTLEAIESALGLGVDWIEVDIFQTVDGHIVVTHDARTGRVAERDVDVAASTLETLQRLDVATGFRRARGLDRAACPPAVMPSLRDVLIRIMAQEKTRISLQPKGDVVDATIALVRALGATRWVGFNDGDLTKMRRVKELAPELPVFWDRPKGFSLEEDSNIARELGFEALVPHVHGLTPDVVVRLHTAGFEVGAWTVNDRDTMLHLLRMGVDRIYTDYPQRLLDVQAQMQAVSPSSP